MRIAVLTVSDTRTKKTDKSGPLLVSMIEQAGHKIAEHAVAEDDVKAIRHQVKRWIKDKEVDVVITTGGTGFTGRDVTPEAVDRGLATIRRNYQSSVSRGRLSARRPSFQFSLRSKNAPRSA